MSQDETATTAQPTAHAPLNAALAVVRLQAQQEAGTASVVEWESFWLRLLREYEEVCRELDLAAGKEARDGGA